MTPLLDALRAAYVAAATACPHLTTVLAEGDAGFADADAYPPAAALQMEVPDLTWPAESARSAGGGPVEVTVVLRVWLFTRATGAPPGGAGSGGQAAALEAVLDLDGRLRAALAACALPTAGGGGGGWRLLTVRPPEAVAFARHDAEMTIARPEWTVRLIRAGSGPSS